MAPTKIGWWQGLHTPPDSGHMGLSYNRLQLAKLAARPG